MAWTVHGTTRGVAGYSVRPSIFVRMAARPVDGERYPGLRAISHPSPGQAVLDQADSLLVGNAAAGPPLRDALRQAREHLARTRG